jgi:hypothetical protein
MIVGWMQQDEMTESGIKIYLQKKFHETKSFL